MRGIFFDEDDARAVVDHLLREGWEAAAAQHRLAGEDDDEDHQWEVVSDAPAIVFEVLVDQHDGWLDEEEPAAGPATVVPPLDLPTAPKRIKRPAQE